MANDWFNYSSDSYINAGSDFWGSDYQEPAEDFSSWGSDMSFGDDIYVDYGNEDWSFTDRPDDSYYSGSSALQQDSDQGGSSLLDAAGGFLSNNWKELLAMFGGGLAGGLSGNSGAASRPSGSGGGSGGSSGPTTTEALAGKSYKVTG